MRRFIQIKQPKATWQELFVALLGGVLGIGILGLITDLTHVPLLWAPFGGTLMLVFTAHASPFSQPLNVLGGTLMAAGLSFICFAILPDNTYSLMITVGLVIAAMRLARLSHPPAAATPIVISLSHASWLVVLPALAIGSLAILVMGWVVHRLTKTHYPV
jgi:CBS-domain-containing membrane protein